MLNFHQVFARLKKLPAYQNKREEDFKPQVFGQQFFPPAGGAVTAFDARPFPVGAIILGITAGAFVPGAAATGQSARNRQLFAIDFAYQGGDAMVIDGPIQADALLGGGEENIFPTKEMIIKATQALQCRVANLTSGSLTVDVAYHCVVDRSKG